MSLRPTPFVGQPLRRLEDSRLLRGQARFLDDLRLPGLHHVTFVRSIHPHARFRVELAYDGTGQPLAQSLLEYTLPRAEQVPPMRIAHLQTPSPLNPLGVKGVGESGGLAPPAALAAAVEDALRPFGARITSTPLRPEAILRLAGGPLSATGAP